MKRSASVLEAQQAREMTGPDEDSDAPVGARRGLTGRCVHPARSTAISWIGSGGGGVNLSCSG